MIDLAFSWVFYLGAAYGVRWLKNVFLYIANDLKWKKYRLNNMQLSRNMQQQQQQQTGKIEIT